MYDQTALAEAEVEYEDHTSPSIYVRFPLEMSPKDLAAHGGLDVPELKHVDRLSVVIWTTTPWTLLANQAIAIHPEIDYAFVRVGNEALIMAEKLVDSVVKACGLSDYSILGTKRGRTATNPFEGLRCKRPLTEGLSPILLGDFVTLDQGTGCVHIAPGHGMEDYLLTMEHNEHPLFEKLEIVVPVDEKGPI